MKVMDTVLPEPKTELEAWLRWRNRVASELRTLPYYDKKKIEVKQFLEPCKRRSLGASTVTNKDGKPWCLLCDRDLDTCLESLE